MQDVVQAKPRDTDDHVAWLVQHGRHEKALEAVEKGGARQEVLEEVRNFRMGLELKFSPHPLGRDGRSSPP